MASGSSSVGSNLTSLSSSSSSVGFHFIDPPSPGSPYVSSPEPNFDPAPAHDPWGFEDGLPIAEADWEFNAMDTSDSSANSDGSYGLNSSADERISWAPEAEDDDEEVNSALIVSDDDDTADAEEWAKWGSSSEDESEDRPKNAEWPYPGPMDVSGDDDGDVSGEDEDDASSNSNGGN